MLYEAEALMDQSVERISNMANLVNLIHSHFPHHWIGFYLVVNEELQLGPFVGPVACTKIAKGKGVCGTAYATNTTQLVDDVHQFEGHIACSPHSKSEIVVPCSADNEVYAVLDIDSDAYAGFDKMDQVYLQQLVNLL